MIRAQITKNICKKKFFVINLQPISQRGISSEAHSGHPPPELTLIYLI